MDTEYTGEKKIKTKELIKVRVTKTVLDTGETKLLVSNLEESVFSTEDMAKLLDVLVEKIARTLVAIKKGRKFSRKSLRKPNRTNQYYK